MRVAYSITDLRAGLILLVASCGSAQEEVQVAGILERDRIELVAESNEPIVKIFVAEGQRVSRGHPLVQLEDKVLRAQRDQAKAIRDRASAQLDELVRGPRAERIDAAQARLRGAEDSFSEATREFERAQRLLKNGTISQSAHDVTLMKFTDARARRDETKAQLDELLEGTTPEKLAQARAVLAEAEAAVVASQTRVDRLTVRAPRDGVIDALPFEVGERPSRGAVVAVMLADGAPYVRCYVPAEIKPYVGPGTEVQIYVDGFDSPFTASVRFISSEAAFTPFFALTEHDRSRLSYFAEIDIKDEGVDDIPSGLPVEVNFTIIQSSKPLTL